MYEYIHIHVQVVVIHKYACAYIIYNKYICILVLSLFACYLFILYFHVRMVPPLLLAIFPLETWPTTKKAR